MGFGFGPELAVMDCGKHEGGRAYAFGGGGPWVIGVAVKSTSAVVGFNGSGP